jgi:anaerobic magnesium-protoporphyrin IX monomethyl ester cyclase
MRILVILPPCIPSYFNAGHHLPLFQVGAYLRTIPGVDQVQCIDAGALNYTWKEIGDLLVQNKYDVIAIMNDFDTIDGIKRFVNSVRILSPETKLITFGRMSKQIPDFFQRYNIDAIVHSGDYEAGVEVYLKYLMGKTRNTPGVSAKNRAGWTVTGKGVFLDSDKWVLPDIKEIPYAAYDNLYKKDENKFCGIPDRRELVVPVGRGCPIGCDFCDVPVMQGLRERRLTVDRTVSYIRESFEAEPFDYVTIYCPTFTLDREWVIEYCHKLVEQGPRYPWKCVTTLYHLDEALVDLMARSGCVRISIGLETLDLKCSSGSLPGIKRHTEEQFDQVSNWCFSYGIELNCFVILGLPGGNVEGAKYTIKRVREKNCRVRPTIYTPYHMMRSDMDDETIVTFNRQQFVEGILNEKEACELYDLIFGYEPSPTKVMDHIPKTHAGMVNQWASHG